MARGLCGTVAPPGTAQFRNPDEFNTREDGAKRLEDLAALSDKAASVAVTLSKDAVTARYSTYIDDLSGGAIPLQYGVGNWLAQMSGKEIFRCIAGPCFRVTARDGSTVQGKDKNKEIAKKLLRLSIDRQPADFRQLVELLTARIDATP